MLQQNDLSKPSILVISSMRKRPLKVMNSLRSTASHPQKPGSGTQDANRDLGEHCWMSEWAHKKPTSGLPSVTAHKFQCSRRDLSVTASTLMILFHLSCPALSFLPQGTLVCNSGMPLSAPQANEQNGSLYPFSPISIVSFRLEYSPAFIFFCLVCPS